MTPLPRHRRALEAARRDFEQAFPNASEQWKADHRPDLLWGMTKWARFEREQREADERKARKAAA